MLDLTNAVMSMITLGVYSNVAVSALQQGYSQCSLPVQDQPKAMSGDQMAKAVVLKPPFTACFPDVLGGILRGARQAQGQAYKATIDLMKDSLAAAATSVLVVITTTYSAGML
jgi:hypothetical protein